MNTRYGLPAVGGADAEGIIELALVQICEVDRDIADIHAAAGRETADVKSGAGEDEVAVAEFQSKMGIEGDRAGPVLGGFFEALEFDVCGHQEAPDEVAVAVVQHEAGFDGRVDGLGVGGGEGVLAVADEAGGGIGDHEAELGPVGGAVEEAGIEGEALAGFDADVAVDDFGGQAPVEAVGEAAGEGGGEEDIGVAFFADDVGVVELIELGDLDTAATEVVQVEAVGFDGGVTFGGGGGKADVVVVEQGAEGFGVHGGEVVAIEAGHEGGVPVGCGGIGGTGDDCAAEGEAAGTGAEREGVAGVFGGVAGQGEDKDES